MAAGQSRLNWFGWLRSFLEGWVRAKLVPDENILMELNVDPARPICYVLKSNTIFDFLILDIFCQKKGLPRPLASIDELGVSKDAASIYLSHVGILRTYGAYRNEPPSPFFKLLRRAQMEDGFDVQMVPVSVFWGRAPNRSEPSVFKLFFPDDDRAGFLQKLLIVLAQGKSVAVNFSKPILLREQLTTSQGIEQTARKLTRVVRVHFQTLRTAVLGPGLISRNRVIETLIRGKALRSAMTMSAGKKIFHVFAPSVWQRNTFRKLLQKFHQRLSLGRLFCLNDFGQKFTVAFRLSILSAFVIYQRMLKWFTSHVTVPTWIIYF